MKAINEPVKHTENYIQIKGWLKEQDGIVNISGNDGTDRVYLMHAFSSDAHVRLVVTYSEQRMEQLYEDFRFYDKAVYMYPSKDILFYSSDIHGNSITRRRMDIFRRLIEGEACTIILTVDALFDRMPDLSYIKKNVVTIREAEELDVEALKKRLVELGYEKADSVDGVGQFAVRGGIIDIFPLTEECPYRIDMWDTEVDTIRSFDVESQRSIEQVQEIQIYPASEMVLSDRRTAQGIRKLEQEFKPYYEKLRKEFKTEEAARLKKQIGEIKEQLTEFHGMAGVDSYVEYFYSKTVSLLDCFHTKNTVILLDETSRISDYADNYMATFLESMESRLEGGYILPGMMNILFTYPAIVQKMQAFQTLAFSILYHEDRYFTIRHDVTYDSRVVNSYRNNFEALIVDIGKWREKNYRIIFISPSTTRAKRMVENLTSHDVACFYSEDTDRVLSEKEVMVTTGRLRAGFEFPELKLVVINEGDVFTARSSTKKKKNQKPRYSGEVIKDFSDISVGDCVIHERYGVGIYGGIEKVEVDGVLKDYVTINYAEGGKLYVLASEVDCIQKYSDKEGRRPKINKLGSKDWEKTRSRVKGHVATIAKELVNLYAKRQASQGFCYSKDTIWQQEFEEMFPYEETDDQKKAIAETKADMESSKIMDRLICGDVGFGKTEVAIRAAFKAVYDGRQVAYLVPTTILAQQHYNTFKERMKEFPVEIRLLCRFCTPKEVRETIADLKAGKVDIVIGTHRLLSKDVAFKQLGLLIIDEEQRFGVTHKEKIKQMKTNVDVLTLTATPIPRTLHMSLIGIRDMSVLEEPPMDRMPIQTYVMEYDEETVREAINRELRRGGQVYYVYNRVTDIADVALRIAKLVPDARVDFAHGQMSERELENVMYSFVNGDIDVLVSTTIIETGLDISNVNTMIIHDSDRYGLSQLYQLRGRIGRSNRTAYAFLMYRKNVMLKETAEKRLAAIREYTDLGSGFKIAMRDLELRGAGNLLGAQQHGHMNAVGYDLYCKMLNEAVKEAKGIHTMEDFETSVDLNVDAYIPDSYISNEFQKLDIYKRIAGIETQQDYDDMLEELLDRFGEPGKAVLNLLAIAKLKAIAHQGYVTEIKQTGKTVRFTLYEKARLNTEGFPALMQKYRRGLQFKNEQEPKFILEPQGNLILALTEFAEELKSMAENM